MEAASVAILNGATGNAAPWEIFLELAVRDHEVIAELTRHSEGREREAYALSALRLGTLAIRQASGVVDAQAVREEGIRLVSSLEQVVRENGVKLIGEMSTALHQYLDPATGDLPQRLERLVKKDGELESLLARHLNGDGSAIARSLAQHVGEESPLFRFLSPERGDGLFASLVGAIEDTLCSQREEFLRQFSFDYKESALSRFVAELTDTNGRLKAEFAEDFERVRSEFSLDNESGALSRLVRRVEQAQRLIAGEFSLDNDTSALSRISRLLESTREMVAESLTLDREDSPLSRLRRELLHVVDELSKQNTAFHTEVRSTLEALRARREEAARSTRHGYEFEDAVADVLGHEAQRLGDVFCRVGTTVGAIPRCKVGDFVTELGSESAAPGARIVCEAKEDASCDLRKALDMIETARKNREAAASLFVFSRQTAPAGIELLSRYGADVVIVWDRDDSTFDVILRAGYLLARYMVVRERAESVRSTTDFDAMEKAVAMVARRAEDLQEIQTWATTVKSHGGRIFDKASRIREDLQTQLDILGEHLENLRSNLVSEAV